MIRCLTERKLGGKKMISDPALKPVWSTYEAIELCRLLYPLMIPYGFFPALTGGALYKSGDRKDVDIILYRHRQMEPDLEGLGKILFLAGVTTPTGTRLFEKPAKWCVKARYDGKPVDLLMPDYHKAGCVGGEY